MSNWSSCNAVIRIYTYRELSNFKELLELALDTAPKITGSEGDCTYTIVDLQRGSSSSYPCSKCPKYSLEYTRKCNRKTFCPGFNSPEFNNYHATNCLSNTLPIDMHSDFVGYIDRCKVVVTDRHGLRDKLKAETTKEFREFINYLKNIYGGIFEVEVITKKIV